MTEETPEYQEAHDEQVADPHYQQAVQQVKDHRLTAMIVTSICISIFLVFVALALYNSSGASQLDLSRPGYERIRQEAQKDDTTISFPATGTLDEAALSGFEKEFDKKLKEAQQTDTFTTDVLSQKSLQIDEETAAAASQPTQQ